MRKICVPPCTLITSINLYLRLQSISHFNMFFLSSEEYINIYSTDVGAFSQMRDHAAIIPFCVAYGRYL